MAANRITIQIKGQVCLDDLTDELKALGGALKYSEKHVSGRRRGNASSIRYEIIDLHHSDATLDIEAVCEDKDFSAKTVATFFDVAKAIASGEAPAWIDVRGLMCFGALGKVIGSQTPTVVIRNRSSAVTITERFPSIVKDLIGPDEFAHGSISGTLEMLSVHKKHQFALYPTIGPTRVVCSFRTEQLEKVIAGIDHYVEVGGLLKCKRRDKFAYAIERVDYIDIKRIREDLPKLSDLAGIVPDLVDGSIEEMLEAFGNDW